MTIPVGGEGLLLVVIDGKRYASNSHAPLDLEIRAKLSGVKVGQERKWRVLGQVAPPFVALQHELDLGVVDPSIESPPLNLPLVCRELLRNIRLKVSDGLSSAIRANCELESSFKGSLNIFPNPNALAQAFDGHISLFVTYYDGTESPELRIHLQGFLTRGVVWSPARLAFGLIAKNAQKTLGISLRCPNGKRGICVVDAKCDEVEIRCEERAKVDASDDAVISITIKNSGTSIGNHRSKVCLTLADEAGRELDQIEVPIAYYMSR